MTDLCQELRAHTPMVARPTETQILCHRAANEIERLRLELRDERQKVLRLRMERGPENP